VSIARGIIRIARFRSAGLAEFEASRQGFLNSLAPLLAFPLVGAVLEVLQGQVTVALADLCASVVAVLVPLVISEALATRWGVGDAWLRYAVASNWSQWAMPLALAALISSLWLLDQMGLKTNSSMVAGGAVGVVCYGVALHYFLARAGLGLSRWKAGGLVALCDVVTVIVVLGPRLLALHLGPNS
jgi:hypothetical protein